MLVTKSYRKKKIWRPWKNEINTAENERQTTAAMVQKISISKQNAIYYKCLFCYYFIGIKHNSAKYENSPCYSYIEICNKLP